MITDRELKKIANTLRQDVIRMLKNAGSGHPGGALGMAEIFSVLYFQHLHHEPKKPNWPDRDRLILSNGHTCPILYAALARSGYFPLVELKTLRQLNSRLQGHPHNLSTPGVEISSGPLGQGISQAVGMAIAGKLDKKNWRVYCVMSDAEHNEGQVWEALMLANKYKLDNLTAIVDLNGIQIDGYTKDIMPLENLAKKYQSFGWQTITIDGNNISLVRINLEKSRKTKKPTVILAKTVLGKGVSFMENMPVWHGQAPSREQAQQALIELANHA